MTPITFNMQKSLENYNAFIEMLKAALLGTPALPVDQVIKDWWKQAFLGQTFVKISLFDAVMKIQYQLLYLGYSENHVKMDANFSANYKYYVQGQGEAPAGKHLYECHLPNIDKMKAIIIAGEKKVMTVTVKPKKSKKMKSKVKTNS